MAFHYLALARPLVVDATQMKNAMYYHPHKLASVGLTKLIGIGSDGIKRYDYIARHCATVGIIKSDNIGIVVMIEKLSVYLKYFLVGAEKVAYLPYSPALPCRYIDYPFFDSSKIKLRHIDALAVP